MTYNEINYEALIGTKGFSEQSLRNHFKLYAGYVANTNKVAALLKELATNGETGPEYAELKRRFGWEFNGMRLHEAYFENMIKGEKEDKTSDIYKKIVEEFESFENWEKDFKATGAIRGIGWVILAYDKEGDRLFNTWINEHDVGHLAGAIPLLVMDVFEHAFMLDYGLNRCEYINTFFSAIDWEVVNKRLSD